MKLLNKIIYYIAIISTLGLSIVIPLTKTDAITTLWPDGFYNQSEKEVYDLIKAQSGE